LGDQIGKNERGGACRKHGEGEMYTGFWWGNLRERDHLEEPGVGGRIILRIIFRKWDGGDKDWIDLAQDTDRCRALVNMVVNFRVYKSVHLHTFKSINTKYTQQLITGLLLVV
jgi:hypothetical protein